MKDNKEEKMKRYFKYLKDSKVAVILAPLLMMVDAMCSVIVPFLIAKIIDNGIGTENIEYIIKIGLYILLAALGILGGGFGCMYFSAKAAHNFGSNLREDIMKKIQNFSFANINKFTTASLITRITNDVEVLTQLLQMSLRMLIRAPFMFIGGIVMAITINKKMSLIIVGIIPFLVILVVIAILKAFPLFTIVQKKIDKVNSIIRENLIGSRVVKAFVREDFEEKRFKKANKDLRDVSIKSYNILILMMPGVTLIMNVAIAAVLWFGAKVALVGGIEIGEISSYIAYITMTLIALIMTTMVLMNMSRSKASSNRILEILNEKPDIFNEMNIKDNKNIIKSGKVEYNIKEFSFKDSNGEAILSNIKFNINSGEKISIIGSTGTGKSTLVNLMPRFYDVTKGYIKIDDKDVREYDLKVLRDGIGMVLQENRLFKGTIRSNLLWGNENATEEELIEACKIAQIYEHISKMKNGFDSVVEQRGTNFSGGQKQRLCIARAIVKKPKILILDDSVSALDSTTEKNLKQALKTELKDVTVFNITQRISSCKDADKIIIIDDGTLVGIGKHEDLLNNNKVYKEIYNSQQEVIVHG